MREERAGRRQQTGTANISVGAGALSGKLVAEAKDAGVTYNGEAVIQNVNTIIQRGDRVGIVGRNGAGKTTLIKMLLGELEPDAGSVKIGSKLEIAYSDQLRGHLDPEGTLIDNICGGQEFIEINGKRKHAIGYLGDFLFSPDRVRAPTKVLSGGERNRAILAKLFTQPANLLVLDEPTNDLDIETLELLEEVLLEFKGTVLLVSHDRDFMDRVVTSLMVINDNGEIEERRVIFPTGKVEVENSSVASQMCAFLTGELRSRRPQNLLRRISQSLRQFQENSVTKKSESLKISLIE